MVSGAKRSLEINGHKRLLVSRAGLSLELLVFRADWSFALIGLWSWWSLKRGVLRGRVAKVNTKV